MIARDLEEVVGDNEYGGNATFSYAAALLALIIHILDGKTPSKGIQIPFDELYRYFCDLRIEVSLEIMSRRTDIRAEPATLETIFTGREVSAG